MREREGRDGKREGRDWKWKRATSRGHYHVRDARRSNRRQKSKECVRRGFSRKRSRYSSRVSWRSSSRLFSNQRSSSRRRSVSSPRRVRRSAQPRGTNRGWNGTKFHSCPSLRIEAGSNQVVDVEKSGDGKGPRCSSLFIDNISRAADDRALRWLLRRDEYILDIFISKKRRANNRLAFALVRVKDESKAEELASIIHGRKFMGHRIFARRAKYQMSAKVNGRVGGSKQGKDMVPPLNPGKLEGVDQGLATSSGVAAVKGVQKADGDGCVRKNFGDVEVVVDGACAKIELMRVADESDPKRHDKVRIVVSQWKGQEAVNEQGVSGVQSTMPQPCPEIEIVTARCGLSNLGLNSGQVGNSWAGGGAPNLYPWWLYPIVGYGYWDGFQNQNFDFSGAWGHNLGWGGSWYYPVAHNVGGIAMGNGQFGAAPPLAPRGAPKSNSWAGPVESGERLSITIRKPLLSKDVVHDPIAEEITRQGRDELNDIQGLSVLNCLEAIGAKPILGNADAGLGSFTHFDPPQMEQVEEGGDGEDLRNLFDEPEFPPGSEPVHGTSGPVASPEDEFVKEEARQTLLLAKNLGCSVIDEGRALNNLESIIREQRGSVCQIGKDPVPGVGGESESCSHNTSKTSSRRRRGSMKGMVSFNKFSRISKIATRSRGRARNK